MNSQKLFFSTILAIGILFFSSCDFSKEHIPPDSLIFENGYDDLFRSMASSEDSTGPKIEPADFENWVNQKLPAGYEIGGIVRGDSSWSMAAERSVDIVDEVKFEDNVRSVITQTLDSDQQSAQQISQVMRYREDVISAGDVGDLWIIITVTCAISIDIYTQEQEITYSLSISFS